MQKAAFHASVYAKNVPENYNTFYCKPCESLFYSDIFRKSESLDPDLLSQEGLKQFEKNIRKQKKIIDEKVKESWLDGISPIGKLVTNADTFSKVKKLTEEK